MKRLLFWWCAINLCLSYAEVFGQTPADETGTARIQLPYNRIVHSAGREIIFGDSSLENHALDCALSPDGQWIAVEERYSLVLIGTDDQKVHFRLPYSGDDRLSKVMATYSGICWHTGADGLEIWWSVAGSRQKSFVVKATWNGKEAKIATLFSYDPDEHADMALPNEIAFNNERGKEYLYVVLNGNNQLIKQDPLTGSVIWTTPTGVAPYGLALAAGKIYVTNWGGRIPTAGDADVAGVPWGEARVDHQTGAVREGSVSVFDLAGGRLLKTIVVGLHPNDIIASPEGKYLYVSDANSDQVTVLNTQTDTISATIRVRLQPEINKYFGDSPDGLGISPEGRTLYVANGMDNALAVVKLGKDACDHASKKESHVLGFIPTGAYPSSICPIGDHMLCVANLEAEGPNLAFARSVTSNPAYNSHHMLTSVSFIPVPTAKELKVYTDTVFALNQLSRVQATLLPPRKNVAPQPIPERVGEPSVFRHVVYIIKENRTYDQELGDIQSGDGDSLLCVFGRKVTPNTHKLTQDFLLMDNYLVSGKCSAEGHQWTDASIVTDYIEKNVRAWFRSYPHVQTDALVYAPSGFLWDNALRHEVSVEVCGEASTIQMADDMTWSKIYAGFLQGKELTFTNTTTISSVRGILSQVYPAYDHHNVPDVVRAAAFAKEWNHYDSLPGDQLPRLMVVALPADHTAGTRPGNPTPRAMVADNDLALGQMIETMSQSRFWATTAVFVTEDDSQDGWDHVSAYRTVGLVASPYSRLGQTIHTNYTQPSMVHTIEQILGLPPMNVEDAIAPLMTDCFNHTPDVSPYVAEPNMIPLDEMNPSPVGLNGRALHYAKMSASPQFDGLDTGDDDLLNHILWFSSKGSIPYPGGPAPRSDDD